jgi:hypothetical protein
LLAAVCVAAVCQACDTAVFLLAFGTVGGLTVVLLLVWQRARGSASGRWRLAARVGLALAVAVTVTGAGLSSERRPSFVTRANMSSRRRGIVPLH